MALQMHKHVVVNNFVSMSSVKVNFVMLGR
jgi:hypothetical protein